MTVIKGKYEMIEHWKLGRRDNQITKRKMRGRDVCERYQKRTYYGIGEIT